MPIIDHGSVPETPWRPNYRKWDLAGEADGITSNLSYAEVGHGAGAPLHYHQDDELIVVLAGVLEVQLGSEHRRVGAEHTVVVPPNVQHSFVSVREEDARVLVFFPVSDPFERTTYLEGSRPAP